MEHSNEPISNEQPQPTQMLSPQATMELRDTLFSENKEIIAKYHKEIRIAQWWQTFLTILHILLSIAVTALISANIKYPDKNLDFISVILSIAVPGVVIAIKVINNNNNQRILKINEILKSYKIQYALPNYTIPELTDFVSNLDKNRQHEPNR
ncbi:hypothetical protein BMW23_0644 [Bodo saltans virus]|uniref:Uncharacterized protein n=1 Tax=Bodo saltans virus TaxID=2024608 RepID=A0A2H4UUU4_9VIRU|nr:hypothetical protein QJ851_gp0627 [Bodo saltans virus]ATZ80690.1 hypothetical protein BMW23_0644 [Bodo saltans virus]